MRDFIARFYSRQLKDRIKELLVYNGIDYDVEHFMGVLTGFLLSISCMLSLLVYDLLNIQFNTLFIGLSLLLGLMAYSYLYLRAQNRGQFVESILSDVLSLMSSNLRAGLSVDRSLMMATRPQFGYFNDEIQRLAARTLSGESFEHALFLMSSRIKSDNFAITVDMIVQGLRSGGELAASLERISDILREREFVRKEIATGVQMYVSFILFAILIGAPLLFGVSSFLIQMLRTMSASFPAVTTASAGNVGPQMLQSSAASSITVDFIRQYSIISLITTSILGSFVVGLISSGNWKNGIKYTLPFCVISTSMFLAINKLLQVGIGNMIS